MTLTEFLLARIVEDEGDARSLGGELRGTAWQGGAGTPERVLAECEAKRRIVERHKDCGLGYGYCDDGGHGWSDDGPGCADLADLARPYADHPDYDEEWKP